MSSYARSLVRPRSVTPVALSMLALALATCGGGEERQGSTEDADATFADVPAADADAVDTADATSPPLDVPIDTSSAEDTVAADTGPPCEGCAFAPCEGNGDCDSGFCLDGPNGLECAKTCSESCPTGYACRGIADASGDPTFVCVYEHITYCDPCRLDADCELGLGGKTGARCVDDGDGHGAFCGTRCDAGSCPEGATCEPVAFGAETIDLCRPTSGECSCSARAVERQASTDCAVANDLGECGGERVCGPEGLSACDAATPAEEVCNGVDDDCDGTTDEGFEVVGSPCDGDDDDLCADGTWTCGEDGGLVCDDDADSKVELCNGVDDDCDLAVDEGFEDKLKPCDGDDDDLCPDGQLVCSLDGTGLVCNDDGASQIELCNSVDDDCDGLTDEGYDGLFEACDGDDADTCADGVVVCSPDRLSTVCTDDGFSRVELCNDVDDDCDGDTDEDFPSKGLACDSTADSDLCADGHWVCADNALVCDDAGPSLVEDCNGVDDDCDGLTDLDDPDLVAPLNPVQSGACAGTRQTCAAGGWSPSYPAGYLAAETPDGSYFDDNCDGLDGDVAHALFVATGGSDNASCSQTSPCQHINWAIGKTSASKRQIYLQAGTYDEVVLVDREVHLYGGYDGDWVRRPYNEAGHKVIIRGAKYAPDGQYVTVRARSATASFADLVLQGASPAATERSAGRGLSSYVVHAVSSNLTLTRVEVVGGDGASGAPGGAGQDAASLSAPTKAGAGGAGTEKFDLCDDSSHGLGASGRTNSQCSSGTGGGKGGDGGEMDHNCSCFLGVCACFGSDCTAEVGTNGTAGSAGSGVSGGTYGAGSGRCQSPGGGGPGGVVNGGGGAAGAGAGALDGDYWYGGGGGSGGLGKDGGGGGGGGGSGGCDDSQIPLQNSAGAGGGGGGAGGCRAQSGGSGGGPGGASIGALVRGGSLTLDACRFLLGNGGAGGAGGAGGQGQPGGAGGDGGSGAGTAKSGGSGGPGGHGGHSGGGGGGAGGPSWGVLKLGATVTTNPATVFNGGSGGAGGAGGLAPTGAGAAANGAAGQSGATAGVKACSAATGC